MGILCVLFVVSPLLLLINICSLCLIFVNLINICLEVFHLGFILFGTLGFLDLGDYFLPHFREVFNYYLLKYFLMVFLFVFWDSCDLHVGTFDIVPEVSEVFLISLDSFLFYPLCFISFHHSVFCLTYSIFCLGYSTVGSLQSVSDLSYCIIFYLLTLFYFF